MIKVFSDMAYEYSDMDAYMNLMCKYITLANTVVKPGKYSNPCYNIINAFDIETSRMVIGDRNPSIMYHWQYAFMIPPTKSNPKAVGPFVMFGRTWDEFEDMLDRINDAVGKATFKIFIHNTKFEFAYLYSRLNRQKEFFKENRYPLRWESDGVVFCDSLAYADNSLGTFTRNYNVPHQKRGGDLDYTVFRDSTTPLTETERSYCYNDVAGLCEAILADLQKHGDNLATMCMTHTGLIRRDFKRAANKANLHAKLKSMMDNYQGYQLSRRAFYGGYTHANFLFSNITVEPKNGDVVKSYDITSDYPFQVTTRKYPMEKFREADLKDAETLINSGKFACRVHVLLKWLELKDPNNPFPFISCAKCDRARSLILERDNGKVRVAAYVDVVVTDVDYRRICKQYNFVPEFIRVDYAHYGYLPQEYRDVMLTYFHDKTKYKTDLKTCDQKDRADIEANLNNSKHLLNGGYGCIATDPLKATITFDGKEYSTNKNTIGEDEYNKAVKHSVLPYQWAAWVTAWARDQWFNMVEGITAQGATVLYGDTDSIKVFIPTDKLASVEKFVADENARLLEIAKAAGGYCDYNGKRVYLGIWDDEGNYTRFKALRAKSYLSEVEGKDGARHVKLTNAGINSKKGGEWLESKGDPFDVYTWDVAFPASVATTTTEYGDDPNYIVAYNGKTYHVGTYVTIMEVGRTLKQPEEYKKLTDYGKMVMKGMKHYEEIQ